MRGLKYDRGVKDAAFKMRRQGKTYNEITRKLGIPKTTLNYWFVGIELSPQQKALIRKNWIKAIINSRDNAIKWHNEQKEGRILLAKNQAETVLSKINFNDQVVLELALAMLYLGEGSKKTQTTSLGSSDPEILKFYFRAIKKLYHVENNKLYISLHLRADQNVEATKKYWARTLNLPPSLIRGVSIDQRTVGRPTYPGYKGVCIIDCGQVAIQRRLVWISRLFCEKISTMRP